MHCSYWLATSQPVGNKRKECLAFGGQDCSPLMIDKSSQTRYVLRICRPKYNTRWWMPAFRWKLSLKYDFGTLVVDTCFVLEVDVQSVALGALFVPVPVLFLMPYLCPCLCFAWSLELHSPWFYLQTITPSRDADAITLEDCTYPLSSAMLIVYPLSSIFVSPVSTFSVFLCFGFVDKYSRCDSHAATSQKYLNCDSSTGFIEKHLRCDLRAATSRKSYALTSLRVSECDPPAASKEILVLWSQTREYLSIVTGLNPIKRVLNEAWLAGLDTFLLNIIFQSDSVGDEVDKGGRTRHVCRTWWLRDMGFLCDIYS